MKTMILILFLATPALCERKTGKWFSFPNVKGSGDGFQWMGWDDDSVGINNEPMSEMVQIRFVCADKKCQGGTIEWRINPDFKPKEAK